MKWDKKAFAKMQDHFKEISTNYSEESITTAEQRGNSQSWGQLSSKCTKSLGSSTVENT